jgi:hypothetical protein
LSDGWEKVVDALNEKGCGDRVELTGSGAHAANGVKDMLLFNWAKSGEGGGGEGHWVENWAR